MRRMGWILVLLLSCMSAAVAEEVDTRFGRLSVDDAKILHFNGKKIEPEISGNNGLSLLQVFRLGNEDVVLVQDNGGSACPAMYWLVTITSSGVSQSADFGTCGTVLTVRQSDAAIWVTLSGYLGPAAAPQERRHAMAQRHVYRYLNGKLTQHGKPVAP